MAKFKFNTKGLNDLQRQLKRMEDGAKELDKTHSVSFSELFTPSFMAKYTSFSSFDELLDAGGFHADTTEEFQAIPDAPFDTHIAATTKFNTWKEMLNTATDEYVARKLGL